MSQPSPSRPSFSQLRGGLRIGPRFFERAGAVAPGPAPLGLIDALADYAHPGMDVSRVHPAIAPFFLDPGALALRIRSRWRFPFSVAWWLARPLARAIGQLALPLARAEIAVRTLALDPAVEGRVGARGVLREHVGGGVMQVIAYAVHRRDDAGYMHATLPLPFSHLAGILRMDPIDPDADGRVGVELTSRERDGDDAAIWLVHRLGAFRAPLEERLRLWPARSPSAPSDLDPEVTRDATLVGRHDQRLFGWLVVRHDYGFRPRA